MGKGYYVSTIGNIIEEAIRRYIQEQQEEAEKEETKKEETKNNLFKRQMVVRLRYHLLGVQVIEPL